LREHEVRQTRSAARRAELEREVYEQLARQVASHVPQLLRVAAAIAELDALASYAQVAHERRFVRPEIADEPETMILGGRHPVVESALGWDAYMPADIHLGVGDGATGRQGDRETGGRADEDNGSTDLPVSPSPHPPVSPSIVVLTGPNMAGKTTYGRMVLLVALMGQCGSFVPAERARLGLVDRVFLRSGAGDDIAGGQSTFMVEMTETAAILRSATRRSLAFFDEVGRGTSTYDGMSIAHAIVEYLASPRRGCRAIFSTHYHELAAIEQHHPTVRNYRMDVQEMPGRIAFTYRVVPGSADRSYGVHVAQLAGLPASVIERATAVLQSLEAQRGGREGPPLPLGEGGGEGVPSGSSSALDSPQSAVGSPHSALLEELADVDVERTTPLEALALLEQLQTQARQLLSPQEADARQKSPAGGANGSSKTSGPARKSKRGARI
jgi:DNA mismatch repair protein MutS